MKGHLLLILLFLNFISILEVYSQDSLKTNKYELEVGTYISSTNNLPFWLRSNQYGEIPLESNAVTIRGQMEKEYKDNDFRIQKLKNWSYGYKVRAVSNVGKNNQFLISEIYFKTRFKALEFYLGRKKEIYGIADSTLSSGSFIWSGNSLPIPKVQISVPNYMPILKNGFISVKGNFAHGWFGSGDSTKNYLLHQKSLYFKFGKPKWNLNVQAGFNHQVQWGGSPRVPFIQGGSNTYITQYGSDLEAYWYVLSGKSLSLDGVFSSGNTSGEGGNRAGNHLGTLDLAIEIHNTKINVLIYKQSIYEDGSLAFLTNVYDGLYGLSITSKSAKNGPIKLNLEFLDTHNQGGNLSSLRSENIAQLRGRDDYFNNSVYEEGWVYHQNTIGSPFLMPIRTSPYLTSNFPTLNPNYILNNRLRAISAGLISKIHYLELKTRFSFSDNLGNYEFTPYSVKQLSIMQQISFPINKYIISSNLAFDNGGLFNKNLGMILLIKKSF